MVAANLIIAPGPCESESLMESYDRKMCLEICKDVCATDEAAKTGASALERGKHTLAHTKT